MLTTFDNLKKLCRARVKDVECLAKNQRYSAAYYLSGYVIELALKALIAKKFFFAQQIPDKKFVEKIHTHNLKVLIECANLNGKLAEEEKDLLFKRYWGIVSEWSEASRYDEIDAYKSAAMFLAVNDKDKGVLRWIMNFW